MRNGDMEAAEQSLREALRLNPGDSDSIRRLGLFLRTIDQPNAAADVLEEALAIDPLSAKVLFELGKAHLHAGRPERVLEIADRIMELEANSIRGTTLRLQSHLWSGQYDGLFVEIMNLLDVEQQDFEVWAHFAQQMDQLGLHDVADRYFARAEELQPEGSAVWLNRVLILHGRGEVEAAADAGDDHLFEHGLLERVILNGLRPCRW